MSILMVTPLILIIILKLAVLYLVPFIQTGFAFDLSPYLDYTFVFVVVMSASMLGIITGFMMIDDKDGKIAELMSITPLGKSGYLINRLLFSSILSSLYSIFGYYALNVVELPFISLLFVSFLSSIYSIIIGLLIFTFADDKVKALAFAKAINSLILFSFTDLLSLKWLTILSHFSPPYYITLVIHSPNTFQIYILSLSINLIWLFLLIKHNRK
jgi:fluoroquinolone transport system permease protein